ncbi:MAG: DUF4167 domain-containing protein [Pseudomonadota bacterium]
MRQNSKNNRSRGRGNRKGPNPLTRSYESNGPDVKVRGTAQHVAEKYMTLARDALASGDSIAAENFFQHAEHYNRIIMAANAQMNAQREEDRRQPSPPQDSPQPQPEVQADGGQNGDDNPIVVAQQSEASGDDASAAGSVNGNGSQQNGVASHANGAPEDGNEQPRKPRSRRAPPRSRSPQAKAAKPKDGDDQTAAPDTIADNPPAFLLND